MHCFDISTATRRFTERLESLTADTMRCFIELPDHQPPANFPAVLYSFATLDYFSSHWAGWNDPAGDRSKKQSKRLVGFMTKYLGYDARTSRISVDVWRHKLMHTGEPRPVRSRDGARLYGWKTGFFLDDHMTIQPRPEPGAFEVCFGVWQFVKDLHTAITGANGYLRHLESSDDLQSKYLSCVREFDSYVVND